MGLSVNMHVYVGTLVTEDEIFDFEEYTPGRCQQCPKSLAAGHKFCSECGHRFEKESCRRWKPQVLAFLNQHHGWGLEAEDTEDFLDGSIFFNAHACWGCEDSVESIGLGIELKRFDMNGKAEPLPLDAALIEKPKADVEGWLKALGFDDGREISIFPHLNVGY